MERRQAAGKRFDENAGSDRLLDRPNPRIFAKGAAREYSVKYPPHEDSKYRCDDHLRLQDRY